MDGELNNMREIIYNITDEQHIIKEKLKEKLMKRMEDGEDLAHLK